MRNSDSVATLGLEMAILTLEANKLIKKMVWTACKLKNAAISSGSVCIHYENDVKKNHFGHAKIYCGSKVRTVRFYHMTTGEYIVDLDFGGKKIKVLKSVNITLP